MKLRQKVQLDSGYLTAIAWNDRQGTNATTCAIASEAGLVHAVDLQHLGQHSLLHLQHPTQSALSQIRFEGGSSSLLWTAHACGQVLCWDLRSGTIASTFTPVTLPPTFKNRPPILSMDVNSDARIVAAGTEKQGEDAFLLFWDVRNPGKEAGMFDETHSDDITVLAFHPTEPGKLVSGSTDGLVCLYDFTHVPLEQDEALYQVIQPDSVSSASFFGPSYEYLSITTHMETMSLWEWSDGKKILDFGDVRGVSGTGVKVDYLVNGGGSEYDPSTMRLYTIAGSQEGDMAILEASLEGLQLRASLSGGHQDIVRGALFAPHRHGGLLLSVGEDGLFCTWSDSPFC